jgi:transcriptional regulator with GAF, ATPase, and Fis domain
MARPQAELFAQLSRELAAEADREGVLRRVVHASVAQIDGAEHAGITVLSQKAVSTPITTGGLVREIDKHQYATGEGPCLTAALQHEPIVRSDDLSTDSRWPRFAPAAVSLGVRSMLSFQLYTDSGTGEHDTIGALNIYAAEPDSFSDDSVHIGTLLAAHAAVAAAAAAKNTNLRIALQTRDTIGQAKGILMERYKITGDQAFDLLIAASQRTHRKLKDIAADLAATGALAAD